MRVTSFAHYRYRVREQPGGDCLQVSPQVHALLVPLLNWHLLIELETGFHASMLKGGGRAENRQEPLSYWHHLLRLFASHPAIPWNKAARGWNKTDFALTHTRCLFCGSNHCYLRRFSRGHFMGLLRSTRRLVFAEHASLPHHVPHSMKVVGFWPCGSRDVWGLRPCRPSTEKKRV